VVDLCGRNDQYNSYSLNGAVFNSWIRCCHPGGQTGSQPLLDAIDQIQVATAPYDVTLSDLRELL
jgi:hypothetical protein